MHLSVADTGLGLCVCVLHVMFEMRVSFVCIDRANPKADRRKAVSHCGKTLDQGAIRVLQPGGAQELDNSSVLLLDHKEETQNYRAVLLLHHLFLPC